MFYKLESVYLRTQINFLQILGTPFLTPRAAGAEEPPAAPVAPQSLDVHPEPFDDGTLPFEVPAAAGLVARTARTLFLAVGPGPAWHLLGYPPPIN